MSIVYFDGGRRRLNPDQTEGIVLEGVRIKTEYLIARQIKPGDLVLADWGFNTVRKLASPEDFKELGIVVPTLSFDWERVIGAII